MSNPTVTQEELKNALIQLIEERPELVKKVIREAFTETNIVEEPQESVQLSEKRSQLVEKIMEEDAELLNDLAQ